MIDKTLRGLRPRIEDTYKLWREREGRFVFYTSNKLSMQVKNL
jgi:hypothetical protein